MSSLSDVQLAARYGTKRQRQIADHLECHDVITTAAMLGITPGRVRAAMSEMRQRAGILDNITPEELVHGLEDFVPPNPNDGWFHRAEVAGQSWPPEGRIKHMFVPDTQCKPGSSTAHLTAAGNYAAAKKPDVIIFAGDHWDMPSLSSYDKGNKSMENRRYLLDIAAGNEGMDAFMAPVYAAMKLDPTWRPRLVFLIGNHEYHIKRYAESHPQLEDAIGYHHFNLAAHGFEVHDFLKPVTIDGITYCHFFPRAAANGQVNTRPKGASSARAQLMANMCTVVSGHRPGMHGPASQHVRKQRIRSIIAGSFYPHDEAYRTPQGNDYWRGILMFHQVHEGDFSLMEVSLDYLTEKYA